MKKILKIFKEFWNNLTNRQFACEFLLQIIVVVSILVTQIIVGQKNNYRAISSEITFAFFSAVGTVAIGLCFENKENRADSQKEFMRYIVIGMGVILATFSLILYFLEKIIPMQIIDILLIIILSVDFIYYGCSFFIRKTIKEKQDANKLTGGAR